MKAAFKADFCSWRRSRLLVVGQGRAGKTSFVRSLRGEKHDAASVSTADIDVSNADVNADVGDLGLDIQTNLAVDDSWTKRERETADAASSMPKGKIN